MDQEWDGLHVDDLGIIALPDTYVEKMSLPPSRRFPWDETKGVYLLNSYHNLHCLVRPFYVVNTLLFYLSSPRVYANSVQSFIYGQPLWNLVAEKA